MADLRLVSLIRVVEDEIEHHTVDLLQTMSDGEDRW